MVLRAWLILGVLLVAVAWVLTVPLTPADGQASPGSMIDGYRQKSLLPAAGGLVMSGAIGHEVFEEPAEDFPRLEAAFAAAMQAMPGMAMDAEKPVGSAGEGMADMGAMPQTPPADGEAPAPDMAMQADGEGARDSAGMAGMDEGAAAHEEEDEDEGGFLATMNVGLRVLAQARAGELPAGLPAAGRTIEVSMREWGYAPGTVMVEPGEVVRLLVRNAGNIPHEFMIMPGPAMQAVDYRLARADWNLTEHEALNEIPVMMPGDAYEVLVRVDAPGMWMFMCMFPYHMQLGMMGALATEGMQGMSM